MDDWPTVVFECGVSESLARLRVDAHWWLTNSHRRVKTLIIINASLGEKKLYVEKWQFSEVPNPHVTRGRPTPTIAMPTCIWGTEIEGSVATEAPLWISFHTVMLRDPILEGEIDFVFKEADLAGIAHDMWRSARA